MNNFKTTDNGGLPFVLDDFRWIDSGYREAFKGIMSAYGVADSTAVIISGCARTVASGTVTIAEGFVSLGGEICYVPTHTYAEPTGGQVEYFDLNVTYDPVGNKPFQSTSNFDTYEKRACKITVASSVPAGYTLYSDAKTIFQLIRVGINLDTWHTLTAQTLPTVTIPGTYQSQYKKDSSEFVHLSGKWYVEDVGVGAVNELITTLPLGYRPSQNKMYAVANEANAVTGAIDFATITIQTNGEIRLKSVGGSFVYIVEFSQIPSFEAI